MAKVLSSISGNLISAASAGFAPTNSGDVSAIASAYQVVSATGTQLYAGTAHVTSINGDPISASRAGNAANASLANSAYYDGTGRLISALPDSAAVSSIASSYATSKQDASGMSAYAKSADVSGTVNTVTNNAANWNGVYTTVYNNSASWSGSTGGGSVTSPSGTIVVMGDQIEGTNSAVLTANAGDSFSSVVSLTTTTIPNYMPVTLFGSTLPGTGATFTISADSTFWDAKIYVSGITMDYQTATASAAPENGTQTAAIQLGEIDRYISASSDKWIYLRPYATAEKEGGITVTGIGELAWKSAVDNVTNTVSSNSATWGQGGGTGNYVETSAINVAIGSSNSVNGTSFAQGNANTAEEDQSFAQGSANKVRYRSFGQGYINTAYNRGLAQGIGNSADGDSFTQGYRNSATSYSFAQGYSSIADYDSFAQGYYASATNTSLAQGENASANRNSFARGRYVSANNSASVFGQYNLNGDGSTSTQSAAFVIGDGTANNARHDLMLVTKDGEITMFSGTADIVGTGIMSSIRAISAASTGGGGGISSATCSSIASAYAKSAVSSVSGDYYGTGNVSGFATESRVSAIAGKYAESAVSAASSNYLGTGESSNYYPTGNPSGFALSSDVSGTVDLVTSQSANWGGSALQLSAGPGVSLTKSGNVLIAGTDETVLYSGNSTTTAGAEFNLNEAYTNFEHIRIYASRSPAGGHAPYMSEYMVSNTYNRINFNYVGMNDNDTVQNIYAFAGELSGTKLTIKANSTKGITTSVTNSTSSPLVIVKIAGINRTAWN